MSGPYMKKPYVPKKLKRNKNIEKYRGKKYDYL